MSLEGSIPRYGHLGAVIYGETAENKTPMEGPHSLFAQFARMDPQWGVVEFNNTNLKLPKSLPNYDQAYRSFRDLFNFDARMVSPMAWNGSNGLYADQPDYVAYTSWRNTPAEDAMKDFVVARADLPRGARLWTFGTARHAADDGWTLDGGTLAAGKGFVDLRFADAAATLVSPPDQVLRAAGLETLYVGLREPDALATIEVFARIEPTSPWTVIVPETKAADACAHGARARRAARLAGRLARTRHHRRIVQGGAEVPRRHGAGAHRPHRAVSAGERRCRRADPPLMTPARPTLAHLDALTGVRALAALWVFVYHAWLASGARPVLIPLGAWQADLTPWFAFGWLGLDIFFVLSGFLLTRQEWIRLERRGRDDEVRRVRPFLAFCATFLRKRILRVYPAYYGCLTLLIALAATHLYLRLPGRLELLLHLGMFHNAVDAYVSTMNGVFWTLPFEWQFYLFFPLLFVLLVRAGPWALAGVGLAIVFAAKAYVMLTGDGTMHAQLPIRLDAFVLGMCAGRLAARAPLSGRAAPIAFYGGLLVLLCTPILFFDLPTGNHYYSRQGLRPAAVDRLRRDPDAARDDRRAAPRRGDLRQPAGGGPGTHQLQHLSVARAGDGDVHPASREAGSAGEHAVRPAAGVGVARCRSCLPSATFRTSWSSSRSSAIARGARGGGRDREGACSIASIRCWCCWRGRCC